jgi:glutamyl-tRNA reductase
LRKRGAEKFIVISRTINSACGLAEKWNGHASTIEDLSGALEETDILITSTSAPHTLIHRGMIEQIMHGRSDRPMVIIDIAVPRDVSPQVGEIENVSLFDIDGLNQGVAKSIQTREGAVPKVERIIDQEYQIFKEYYASLKVVPVIVGMRQQADDIRRNELEKTLRKLDRLDPQDQEQIVALTHSIVQKILHEPTIRLREEANGPNGEKYAGAVRALFGLDQSSSQGAH